MPDIPVDKTTDLFGGALPPALSPRDAAARREADILLLSIPPRPGSSWIDAHALPAARELVRQGRARLTWLREPGVYELRRAGDAE